MDIVLTIDEKKLNKCAELMCASEPWVTLNFTFDQCMKAVRGDYKEVYIATENDKLSGFVVIQLYGVLRGYIQTICIKPEYRNKGIGSALIKHCEERIAKISPNVFICVSSFNKKAEELYGRLGFEKIGVLKDHIVRGHDEYLLRKSSGPFSEFIPPA